MERKQLTTIELRALGERRDAYARTGGKEGKHEALAAIACVGGDLSGLVLSGIVGINASLPGVSFKGSYLSSATLIGLIAPGAKFDGATVIKADLSTSQLANSSFVGANLFRSDLSESDLRGVDLRNADLRSVDFNDSDLRGALIDGARFDQHTTFVNAQLDFDPDRLTRE